MPEMITVDRLTRCFGSVLAVDEISLAVGQGEVLGFLGPNGAGKTTTMRMIAGYLEPSSGTARVCGCDLAREPIKAKRHIGYLPEGAPLYGDMTCRRFLDFTADVRGYSGDERRRRMGRAVELLSLDDVIDQPIDTLSKGFKRRVGLAQALIHDPDVLILDEPTDGLDPNQKHHVRELIRSMAPNKAIIISTHILEEVEAVCTRAVIIAHGRIVADGTAEHLLSRLPHHNAVVATVAAADSGAARQALMPLIQGDMARLAEQSQNGLTTFRVDDHGNGTPFLAEAAHRLRQAGVSVENLYQDRGRLDDIFRMLTETERGTGEDRHAA